MSAYSVSIALRASIALGSQPGALVFEVCPPDVGGYRFPEVNERFSLDIIEQTEKSGGVFVQCVGRGIDGERGRRRWHG